MSKGDPWRQEWRLGIDHLDGSGTITDQWKLSGGWRYRFSPRAEVLVDAALVRPAGGELQHLFGIGLSVGFERNLRVPQRPPGAP